MFVKKILTLKKVYIIILNILVLNQQNKKHFDCYLFDK